jgi:hypothetical protein
MLWVMVTMYATRLISKGFIVMESLLRTKIAHGNKLETF